MWLNIEKNKFIESLNRKVEDKESNEEIRDWLISVQSNDRPEYAAFRPTNAHLDNLRRDITLTLKSTKYGAIERVQEWFKQTPHLPQPTDDMVKRFLWATKFDEEQCKRSIKKYYDLRGTDDEIFGNRDPALETIKRAQSSIRIGCLQGFTPELYRITFCGLEDDDAEKFSPVDWARQLFYIADIRARDDYCLGDVTIIDLKNFTFQHLMKITLPFIRKLIMGTERALPSRLKQIHYINSPSFVEKLTSLIKPLLKEKMAKRVYVHTNGYEGLHEFVPKELLPKEYGGSAMSLKECSDMWHETVVANRDWFIQEERNVKRMYKEAKMSGKLYLDCGDLFGMDGSFKKLTID